MRLSRTNISNAVNGFQPEGEPDPDQAAEEARRAEQIAARRAFLEEKIRVAREAKHQAEERRRAEERRLAEEARLRIAAAPKPVVEALQASTATNTALMPVTPHGISAEELASPGWQNAFLMGPNVRFTRTRENEIVSRRPPVEAAPSIAPAPQAVNHAAMRVIEPPVMAQPVAAPEPQQAPSVEFQLPPWEDMPFPAEAYHPAVIQKSPVTTPDALEMTVIATAFHKAPAIALDASPSLPKVAESAAAPVVESRLAHLSDFAFWDAMPFDGEFVAAIKGTPAQPVLIPEVDIQAESIIAKFRVVECRRPATVAEMRQDIVVPVDAAQPAPVEPQPVAKVAPISAAVSAAAVVMDELVALEAMALTPVLPAVPAVVAPAVAEPEPVVQAEPVAFVPPAFVTAVFADQADKAVETSVAPVAGTPAPVMVVAPMPVRTSAAPAVAPVVEAKPVMAAVEAAKQRLIDPPPSQVTPRRPNAMTPPEWRPIARSGEGDYELPPRELLQEPVARSGVIMTQETLEQNAGLLESVLEDFGVKGEIIHVRPGPVVTLYEFEPAPGVKSSRVINLADDIARSMSALSARVAVVPGRNVIGIELPNVNRETVYFREMIDSPDFEKSGYKLALGLGKTIGGEPVIAELAKMPHLLVAGTTGSGKSVAINT
ncbi:MAG: DNA translocase FtsK, partial [Rhizobium sp.]